MLASRQLLGQAARSRVAFASHALHRTMATVSDNPLDRKVSCTMHVELIQLRRGGCRPFERFFAWPSRTSIWTACTPVDRPC